MQEASRSDAPAGQAGLGEITMLTSSRASGKFFVAMTQQESVRIKGGIAIRVRLSRRNNRMKIRQLSIKKM